MKKLKDMKEDTEIQQSEVKREDEIDDRRNGREKGRR